MNLNTGKNNQRFTIYLSEEQKQKVESQASMLGISISQYIKKIVVQNGHINTPNIHSRLIYSKLMKIDENIIDLLFALNNLVGEDKEKMKDDKIDVTVLKLKKHIEILKLKSNELKYEIITTFTSYE